MREASAGQVEWAEGHVVISELLQIKWPSTSSGTRGDRMYGFVIKM